MIIRPIKFRYNFIKKESWIQKVFTLDEIECGALYSEEMHTELSGYEFHSRDEFTGQIDSRGNEIFEWDICERDIQGHNLPVSTLRLIINYYVDGFKGTYLTKLNRTDYLNQTFYSKPKPLNYSEWPTLRVIGNTKTLNLNNVQPIIKHPI